MQTALARRLVVDAPLATITLFVLVVVTSGVASSFATLPETSESANLLARVFLVCAVNATLLTWTLLRSAASGGRLVLLVVALYFGIGAFMTQNETLYFNSALDVPAAVVNGHLAASFVTALLFAAGIGRWIVRRRSRDRTPDLAIVSEGRGWKIAVLACLFYPALYFLFGYFVLWQNDAARQLYQGSSELLPAWQHLAGIFRDDPWLYPWQCLRGLVWVGLALLVVRDSTAGRAETAVLVGLLFALLMNMQHLIPNPFMPPEVRLWHFLETASSNFLLGAGIVAWLTKPAP